MLAVVKMVDEITYMVMQVEMIVFGEYKKRMPVRIYTDSEPLLESIASSRQMERKNLRMTVQGLKERLIEGYVKSYQ